MPDLVRLGTSGSRFQSSTPKTGRRRCRGAGLQHIPPCLD